MLAHRTASETPFSPGGPSGTSFRPAPKAFGTGFTKKALDWTNGAAQPAIPDALRDFLDRIGQSGSPSGLPSGLDGLVGPFADPRASPSARGCALRDPALHQRSRKPGLQALHPERVQRTTGAAHRDAARLHPEP